MMDDDDIDQAMGMLDGIIKEEPVKIPLPPREEIYRLALESGAIKNFPAPVNEQWKPKPDTRIELPPKLGGTPASRKFGVAPARGDARSAVATDAYQPSDTELFIKLGSDGALILSVDVGGQRVSRTVFPNENAFSALEVRGAICKLQDAVDALKDKK